MVEFIVSVLASLGSELIIGLVVAALIAAYGLFKKHQEKKQDKEKQRLVQHKKEVMKGLNSYVVATEDLRELCLNTGSVRGLIVQLHNSGNKPQLGRVLKTTVVAEWARDSAPLISGDYQGVVVDADYILSVVSPAIKHEEFYLTAESMREGSFLRDKYAVSGVVGSQMVLLGVDDDTESTFILSAHFTDHPGTNEKYRNQFRDTSRAIKQKLGLI